MPFALGQRWISDTESDLGLGTIIALDPRTLTLQFPASGETRLYTRNDAPVTRVTFDEGDTITSQEGWSLIVEQVIEQHGLLCYQGTRLDTSEMTVSLEETQLSSRMTFSKPQDRLFVGQLDRLNQFVLRYKARQYQSEQFSLPSSGLRGIRANLIPHQLHIANEVAQRAAPRVLLADEVGLGKTIEAGLILHQRLLTGSAERVLIIVPESLQHQWFVEMLRRFNLSFSLFDESRYNEAMYDTDNPFETEQLVICSLNFVYRNKQRLEALMNANWDLLVVDEAHHLVWHENEASPAYRAIEKLAEVIPSVLLLTATPEQLGLESHFARLRLLDANRFHDYSLFIEEQKHYHAIADVVNTLLTDDEITEQQIDTLTPLISEQKIELRLLNQPNDGARYARDQLIHHLMDRHGTSRVLFKNTRQGVKGFPTRQLHAIELPLPHQYQTAMKVNALISSKQSLAQKAQNCLYPEQIFQALEGNDVSWMEFDPRVNWLIDFLMTHRQEKVLVICSNAQTVLQLEQALRTREAIRSAIFHEGLSLIERDRAAAYFASQEQGAQVLLCSEIGSEGRNFQFSNHLVMFDLPMNPDLLEQRIGRLDRIGQARDVQIMVPYLANTAQAILLHWFHQGLNAFEQTCSSGRVLFDALQERLLYHVNTPTLSDEFTEFVDVTQQRHQQLKTQLAHGQDRLLELHSCGGEGAQQLVKMIAQQDNSVDLVNFTFSLFDIIGIDQEDQNDMIMLIKPSDHMLVPDFPGIPSEGCLITFDRQVALSREDAQFISWEHPIIRNGIDLILSNVIGTNTVALFKNKALPVGTLFLELIYVVEATAPNSLQLQRFLPVTPIRLLLDAKGNNLADKVGFEPLNKQLSPINRHHGRKIVQALQQNIRQLLQQSEALIETQANALINTVTQQAVLHLEQEIERLQALQRVNSTIRDDEITLLQQQKTAILTCLKQAQWRLDALRLIVVSHQ